ncbi:hypothetical protein GGR58DRAFT_461124 [Xylaria digitata]|nr:hypothetical protein GGR58DRAFT_461124 [Xylaria digitata]
MGMASSLITKSYVLFSIPLRPFCFPYVWVCVIIRINMKNKITLSSASRVLTIIFDFVLKGCWATCYNFRLVVQRPAALKGVSACFSASKKRT